MMNILKKAIFFVSSRPQVSKIPSLKKFMQSKAPIDPLVHTDRASFHIETYGCQMNVNDSEIVRSLLLKEYNEVEDVSNAEILVLNTCAIREAAEEKVMQRIKNAGRSHVIAVLGCMAERLKSKLFKAGVHVVCGPDAYRDLPKLLSSALVENENQMNVMLSAEETYADITPVRKNKESVNAFISIMRGCNNMCSYCIVPFVRGRERSRNLETILQQIEILQKEGVKQITFLGQNVNSYHDTQTLGEEMVGHQNSAGFSEMFKLREHPGARFADLLVRAAEKFPNIRFRFTSPHPKDFPDGVIAAIQKYNNICKHVHLPAQSGNNQVLSRMRRNHTIEAYYELASKMRKIKGLALSTDLIVGFCGQTQQQFKDTLKLIRDMKYQMGFLFSYSMRERTHAHRNYQDDVPEETKKRRLKQLNQVFLEVQAPLNNSQQGNIHLLLLQGKSKRDEDTLLGKTDNFKNGYVKKEQVPIIENGKEVGRRMLKIGDYLAVRVNKVGPRALFCQPLAIASTLNQFFDHRTTFESLVNYK